MVSRQSPDKRAVGCTGALLSFGYCCVEVCPKGGDVGLDLAGLDVGEDKAQGVSTGGMAEHLSQPSNVMSRSAPDFGLSADCQARLPSVFQAVEGAYQGSHWNDINDAFRPRLFPVSTAHPFDPIILNQFKLGVCSIPIQNGHGAREVFVQFFAE